MANVVMGEAGSRSADSVPPPSAAPLLVITGMAKEIRIASGPAAVVIGSGGDPVHLGKLLDAQGGQPFRAVLSFGIAGGLDPALKPGDAVVGAWILAGTERWATDHILSESLFGRLKQAATATVLAGIAGSDAPVMNAAEKAARRELGGAAAVDMESHVAARFAAERDLPLAAIRVVCDPARRSLPPLASNALRPDGGVNLTAILASLARNPGQIAALPRLAADAAAGFRALRRCGDLLGVGRGLPDFRELLRHVA